MVDPLYIGKFLQVWSKHDILIFLFWTKLMSDFTVSCFLETDVVQIVNIFFPENSEG